MAIRKIHEVGDPCLTKVCRPVTEFNNRLHVYTFITCNSFKLNTYY